MNLSHKTKTFSPIHSVSTQLSLFHGSISICDIFDWIESVKKMQISFQNSALKCMYSSGLSPVANFGLSREWDGKERGKKLAIAVDLRL
jgi:hypothetical protein